MVHYYDIGFNYDTSYSFNAENYSFPGSISLSNNNVLIYGEHITFGVPPNIEIDLAYGILDEYADIQYMNQISTPDTFDVPGRADFINLDAIFISGAKNYQSGYEYSWISLYKTDSSGEKIFSKFFGGNGKYSPPIICATSDGGCLLASNYWDFNAYPDEVQHDIVILKVNSEGLITNIKDVSPIEITDVILYPNPGSEYVSLGTSLNNLKIEFYTINGHLIFKADINNGNSINTAELLKGAYIYKIIQDNSIIKSGKWVKID